MDIAKTNSACKLADVLHPTQDAIANVRLNKYFRGKESYFLNNLETSWLYMFELPPILITKPL